MQHKGAMRERHSRLLGSGIIAYFFVFIATTLSIGLVSEHAKRAFRARQKGFSCMALVDPTVHFSKGQPLTALEGIDPEAAHDLASIDPEGSVFLEQHPTVSITILDGDTYNKCFGRSDSTSLIGSDAIFLNNEQLPSHHLRAIAVSNELVHVEQLHIR